MKVDLLYLAWQREEFTRESLRHLYLNTDWSKISKLYIYTDAGSGLDHGVLPPFPSIQIVTEKFGSPVGITNDYLNRADAEIFVKLDNDVMCPPGWLDDGLRLMEQHPYVDLLGIEAHLRPPVARPYGITLTGHIGGIGFMRREAFRNSRPSMIGTRYGFSEWQAEHLEVVKALIDPPLHVFLLDHISFESWSSLSAEYRRKGWQRDPPQWGDYGPEWSGLWDWWKPGETASQPSAGALTADTEALCPPVAT